MSTSSETPSSGDDLQFSTVERANNASMTASVRTCAACGQPITSTYFALGDKLLCPTCQVRILQPPSGNRLLRVVKATLMGLGAGLIGALIWFAVRRVTNMEIGLVAILLGWLVGKAVRKGSGNRGGRGYQVLAVVLTYCCIAANYMPDVFEAVLKARNEHHAANAVQQADPNNGAADNAGQNAIRPAPDLLRALWALVVLTVLMFAFALALPFLAGTENIIGLLIIAFALWEAWKFNARRRLPISGPYQLGPVTQSHPLISTVTTTVNAPGPT